MITNTINGKSYIGQTKQTLLKRWKRHNKKGCRALYSAIKKYGAENFTIESICEPPIESLMCALESYYIAHYNTLSPNGYNLRTGGEINTFSEETRKKLSIANLGNKKSLGYRHTEEARKRISEANSGNKFCLGHKNSLGYKHTSEFKEKLSKVHLGNKHALGYKHTDEECQKISKSLIGNKRCVGYKHTDKARKNMSEGHLGNQYCLGYKHTEEARRNMASAQKARRQREAEARNNPVV